MSMKGAAFARKQVALRQAVAIGDAILRAKRRELVAACFGGWRMRARVLLLVQQRLGERLRGSLAMAWAEWMKYHRLQVSIDSILAGAEALCISPGIVPNRCCPPNPWPGLAGPPPQPASCVPQLPGRLGQAPGLASLACRGHCCG